MTVRTASGTAYLVRDRATRDGGRAMVFTDITERHRAETALAEQTKALENTRDALNVSEAEARTAGELPGRTDTQAGRRRSGSRCRKARPCCAP